MATQTFTRRTRRNLNLEVVAEGVETQAVWDQLTTLGCGIAQGYFLTPPLPPEEFRHWLAGQHVVQGAHRQRLISPR